MRPFLVVSSFLLIIDYIVSQGQYERINILECHIRVLFPLLTGFLAGYGIPIEIFGPFVESCVQIMRTLISEFPNDNAPQLKHESLAEKNLGYLGTTPHG